MKITKVLNPITLNAILHWSLPVRHLPALFRYFLRTYDHSFLKVFIFSQHILKIFQLFSFSTVLQISPQTLLLSSAFGTSFSLNTPPLNFAYIFFWSKSKILFCLNCSVPCSYLLILALFASILCFSSWIISPFLFTLHLSFNLLNLHFIFNPSFPLDSLSRNLISCLSLVISPTIDYFSILVHFSSYTLLSSTLSIPPTTHLQP